MFSFMLQTQGEMWVVMYYSQYLTTKVTMTQGYMGLGFRINKAKSATTLGTFDDVHFLQSFWTLLIFSSFAA